MPFAAAVDALTEGMYRLSNLLLVPVILVVIVLFFWVVLLAGGFLREWAERRRVRRGLAKLVADAHAGTPDRAAVWVALKAVGRGLPTRLASKSQTAPADVQVAKKLLADLEADVADVIGRLSFLSRVGPMLGLMGTLIPLGPALTGLGSGNIQQLSSNLVLAFSTTVVGLVVASAAFGMGVARRGWYARDLDDLGYVLEKAYGA